MAVFTEVAGQFIEKIKETKFFIISKNRGMTVRQMGVFSRGSL
jgi:hypothetical protein